LILTKYIAGCVFRAIYRL